MQISIERKKSEAIERMRILGFIGDCISAFSRSGKVMTSEPPFGALYYVNEEQQKMIRDFETENNALVYAVVRSYASFGKMDAIFYVSDYEEEWEFDIADIRQKRPFVYVYNYDAPEFSEFGHIAITPLNGGLLRTS